MRSCTASVGPPPCALSQHLEGFEKLILGLYRDNGKENGNYYIIIGYTLGLYRDNGNYYIIIGVYRLVGCMLFMVRKEPWCSVHQQDERRPEIVLPKGTGEEDGRSMCLILLGVVGENGIDYPPVSLFA